MIHEIVTSVLVGFVLGTIAGGVLVHYFQNKSAQDVEQALHGKIDALGKTVLAVGQDLVTHINNKVNPPGGGNAG